MRLELGIFTVHIWYSCCFSFGLCYHNKATCEPHHVKYAFSLVLDLSVWESVHLTPKAWELATPARNKDHDCHVTGSFNLLLSPSLSSALVLACPPSFRHAAVPVERLMHGYNVLHCAFWRLALLFTRNLYPTPICFSLPLSHSHFFLSSIFYPLFIILTAYFKNRGGSWWTVSSI